MSLETYIWLLLSLLVAILLLGIFVYIVMLRKLATRNQKYFGEFAKALMTGLAGGTVLYVATKLEGIFSESGFNVDSIISMLVVFLLAFFVMLMGAIIFIAICKKLEN